MNLSIKLKLDGCGRRFGSGKLVLQIGGRFASNWREVGFKNRWDMELVGSWSQK